jgi:hypothetical protein
MHVQLRHPSRSIHNLGASTRRLTASLIFTYVTGRCSHGIQQQEDDVIDCRQTETHPRYSTFPGRPVVGTPRPRHLCNLRSSDSRGTPGVSTVTGLDGTQWILHPGETVRLGHPARVLEADHCEDQTATSSNIAGGAPGPADGEGLQVHLPGQSRKPDIARGSHDSATCA